VWGLSWLVPFKRVRMTGARAYQGRGVLRQAAGPARHGLDVPAATRAQPSPPRRTAAFRVTTQAGHSPAWWPLAQDAWFNTPPGSATGCHQAQPGGIPASILPARRG